MGGYYDEIEIEDMTFDPVKKVYHYPCPCGDRFEISKAQLRNYEDIATCPSCSLIIRVIFDPLDFEDEDDDDEEEEEVSESDEDDGASAGKDSDEALNVALRTLKVDSETPIVEKVVPVTKDTAALDNTGHAKDASKESAKAADAIAGETGSATQGSWSPFAYFNR